jgi:hypothetical protein
MPIAGNNMHGAPPTPPPSFPVGAPPWIVEVNFREFVDFLFPSQARGDDGFMHAATGLAGESGEVLDHMKKCWVYGRGLDDRQGDRRDGRHAPLLLDDLIKMRSCWESSNSPTSFTPTWSS